MNNDSAFLRQWQLLKYIGTSPQGVTYQELADHFSVSVKTVRRDIRLLQQIPFAFDKRGERREEKKIFLRSYSPTESPGLTYDELFALYISRNLMLPLQGTNFWDSLQSGFKKIKKMLRQPVIEYAERISPMFYQLEPVATDYTQWREEIDIILVAMEDCKRVQISYQSLRSETVKTYLICPYTFLYHHGFLYVIGWSCKDEEIRFWKINRLKNAVLTKEPFERDPGFKIEDYMKNAFCPFIGDAPKITVTVRFKKSIAPYIQELGWESFKKMTTRKDGSLLVEMEMEGGKPLLDWLLRFGSDVKVLRPKEFRDEYIKRIQQILAQYKNE